MCYLTMPKEISHMQTNGKVMVRYAMPNPMHFGRRHGQLMHKLVKSLSSAMPNIWVTYVNTYFGHIHCTLRPLINRHVAPSPIQTHK